jgi:ribose/xylose/arabinose/galactoside ABC-type transport system permease subunit
VNKRKDNMGETGISGAGKVRSGFVRRLLETENAGIVIFLVCLFVLCAITSETFLRPRNVYTVLRQVSVLGICSFGAAVVLLIGGIDLSIGSCAAFSGVVTAYFIQRVGVPIPLSVVLGVLAGGVVGLVNGTIVAVMGIPAIVTTIGTMTLFRGLAFVLCGSGEAASYGIIDLPQEFKWMGGGNIGILPIGILFTVAVFIILALVVNRMPFGRYIYAIGSNEESAVVSGIQVGSVKALVFVISGMCAGLGGVLLASRMNSGQPTAATGLEIDVLTAVVLGGVSTVGGKGKLTGVVVGVLIIGLLQNWLILMNVAYYYQLIIKGCVLIAAVLLDLLRLERSLYERDILIKAA